MKNKEEWTEERRRAYDEIIDKYDMTRRCAMSREAIYRRVERAMVSLNLAHIMSDVVNSLVLDVEDQLKPMCVAFARQEKYNFKQMLEHVKAAKKWAERSTFEAYIHDDADLFCDESDLWYNLVRLIEDRTGADKRKNRMLIEWLVNMPSELNVFNIKEEDFMRYEHQL